MPQTYCSSKTSRLHAFLLCLSILLIPSAVRAHPVINEIFFHPASHGTNEEFIELYNPGPEAVDLFGWQLTKGVSFTFSNHWVMSAGSFAVIAANTNTFLVGHPSVAPVFGNWIGTLANSGESLNLVDNQGAVVDQVRYADSGDFGQRRQVRIGQVQGWTYDNPADGGGSSLERVRAEDSGLFGANWAASIGIEGTPGAKNSRLSTEAAPYIANAHHAPALPRSTDAITITANITPGSSPIASVVVWYRNVATPTPGPFLQIPMSDDGTQNDGLPGDGLYGAVLSPQTNRTVLEFFVQSFGSETLQRTWPAASLDTFGVEGQFANALLQVVDTDRVGALPYRFLVLTEQERRLLISLQDIDPFSELELNVTFIDLSAGESGIRYGCGIRLRGASSRYQPPANFRVHFPSDRRWNGRSAINFNSHTVHSQIAGYALATQSGLVTEEHQPVQVRINANNVAGTPYAQAEVPDSDFAAAHFPRDPDGNVYRASSTSHSADLLYLGTNINTYLNNGYSKTTHQNENDWSDIFQLTQTLSNPGQTNFLGALSQVVNVPQWLTYFAVFSLTGSTETSLGTGVGDDYAMYRGMTDPRFQLIGHDWDSILGQDQDATTVGVFEAASLNSVSSILRHPDIAPQYFAELLRLLEGPFEPGQVARLLDETTGGWAQAVLVQSMKRFATNRFNSVMGQIPTDLRWRSSSPITLSGSAFPRSSSTNITLVGWSHAVKTRSVLVNGAPVQWSAWEARWTAPMRLAVGLNSILVQALDASNAEFERTNFTLLVQGVNGAPLSGQLPGNTVLSKQLGPYRISADLEVPAGGRLTVEPGTSLYFDPGARLLVSGTLNASGTETQRIYFSRFNNAPASNNWGGLQFTGNGTTQHLSYVVFDGAGAAGPCIQATNVVLEMDHLQTFATTRGFLAFSNCSVALSDSLFSGISDPALIEGRNIRAEGVLRLNRNVFLAGVDSKDVLRFSGAQRPGPILELVDNQFLGAGDDLVELTDADAHIEGNLFANARKAVPDSPDLSTAVAVLGTRPQGPSVTLARNRFVNDDFGILCRDGSQLTLQNNSFVSMTRAAISFDEPQLRGQGARPGGGALLENTVVWSTPTNFAFPALGDPNFGTTGIQIHDAILSGPDIPAGALNWRNVDPRFAIARPSGSNPVVLLQALTLQPGSPALGAGSDGRDLGAGVAAGLSLSVSDLAGTSSGSKAFHFGGAGIVSYRWKLDDGPLGNSLPVGTPLQLNGLAPGVHRLFGMGQNSAGTWEGSPRLLHTWQVQTGVAAVVIQELLALNDSAYAVNGQFPDALELFNPGDLPIDLDGMGLTDDPALPHKYALPPGTRLLPGTFLVIQGDSRKGPGLHSGFGFSAEGGALYLFAPGDDSAPIVDQVHYGLQIPNYSIGRMTDGTWTLCLPTLGLPNRSVVQGNPLRLVINEWLATDLVDDFVELFNPDPQPTALNGLALTDDPINYPARYPFPPLSYIEGLGFRVWTADGDQDSRTGHLNFRLRSEGGQLALSRVDSGRPVDTYLYQSQKAGISQGRSPSGATRLGFFSPPTPGAHNPAPPPPLTNSVTTVTADLVSLTNQVWRFLQNNVDQGVGWRQTAFNDASWPQGNGLLGVEDCNCLPAPLQTPLSLLAPDGVNSVNTYYFRTRFVLSEPFTNNATFRGTLLYDDGLAVYINGKEAVRRNLASTATHTNFALSAVVVEGIAETVSLPASLFVPGTNTIAVEVHQNEPFSPDVVMGLSLRADRSFTNQVRTQGIQLSEVLANNVSVAEADGTISDWVELRNLSKQEADLSDMSLSDNSGTPRRWVFPPGTTIPGDGHRVIRMDSSSPATLVAAPVLNTGFGLSAQGDQLFLFDSTARNRTLLDSVQFGPQAANYSIGRTTFVTNTWALNLPSPGDTNTLATLGDRFHLRVNEWMASPSSGDDWFELYNPEPLPVALSGLFLTDDLARKTQFTLSPLSFIGVGTAGGFTQFIADGSPGKGASHVPFKLANEGELIALFDLDGSTAIDIRTFGAQKKGISEGRFPDGSETLAQFPRSPTPGAANVIPFSDIRLHEIVLRSSQDQAVELWNNTDQDQWIGGWWLSTDTLEPRQYRLPASTVIPAGGFLVLTAEDLQKSAVGGRPLILDPVRSKSLILSVADTAGALSGLQNEVKLNPTDPQQSQGGYLTSFGWESPLLTEKTLGASNALPRVGPLVISEIHYHPTSTSEQEHDQEFLELQNVTGASLTLTDASQSTNVWHIRNAVSFNLPASLVIPAQGFVILVGFDPETNLVNTTSFRTRFGVPSEVPVLGPWEGQLDNSGDTIELNRPGVPVGDRVPRIAVDRVAYRDLPPWPLQADVQGPGLGYSLQRRGVQSYGNEPTNWLAALPTAGRANQGSPVAIPSLTSPLQSLLLAAGARVTLTATATGASPFTYQWTLDSKDILDATNASLTVTASSDADAGVYAVRISNPWGSAWGPQAIVKLQTPPAILRQPNGMVVQVGDPVTLQVGAVGTPPLRYQWWRDASPLLGETRSLLDIKSVLQTDLGAYRVVVSNAFGAATSSVALVETALPPDLVKQPTPALLNVVEGQEIRLDAAVSGSAPLRVQWRRNGSALRDATNSSLVLPHARGADAGQYTLFVSNPQGTRVSDPSTVNVFVAPLLSVTSRVDLVREGDAAVGAWVVSRTGSNDIALSVPFKLSGTATAGLDYEIPASPLTFPARSNTLVIPFAALLDGKREARESAIITLLSSDSYALNASRSAKVDILDGDNRPPIATPIQPTPGQRFPIAPTNIVVEFAVVDPDSEDTVSSVTLIGNETQLLGTLTTPPWRVTWTNPPAGSNQIVAIATDTLGGTGISAPLLFYINQAPQITQLTPDQSALITPDKTTLVLGASATDADGTIESVRFILDGLLVGTVKLSPYTLSLPLPAPGRHELIAIATDNSGLDSLPLLHTFTIGERSTDFTDLFASRGLVRGAPLTLKTDNSFATLENNEPLALNATNSSRSLWIEWVAPFDGVCSVDTLGSSNVIGEPLDSVIAVYLGDQLPTLWELGSDDDSGDVNSNGFGTSRLSFACEGGVRYQIRLNAYESGPLQFHLKLTQVQPVAVTGDAVEQPSWGWRTLKTFPWIPQGVTTSDNVDAFRSGVVTDRSVSWVETSIEGPTLISFRWRMNGLLLNENGFVYRDHLVVRVDDTQVAELSQRSLWASASVGIPLGTHRVRWSFIGGSTHSSTSQRFAYLDVVEARTLKVFAPAVTNLSDFSLIVEGFPNTPFTIETSSNLLQWLPIYTDRLGANGRNVIPWAGPTNMPPVQFLRGFMSP